MSHDPDEEVTVISSEGIGRGVLRGNTIKMVGPPRRVKVQELRQVFEVLERKEGSIFRTAVLGSEWVDVSDTRRTWTEGSREFLFASMPTTFKGPIFRTVKED